MEKIEKDKAVRSRKVKSQSPRSTKVNPRKVKVNPEKVKVNLGKVKVNPDKAEAEKWRKYNLKGQNVTWLGLFTAKAKEDDKDEDGDDDPFFVVTITQHNFKGSFLDIKSCVLIQNAVTDALQVNG
nr:hypothetical protein [Tanacetum cinerariifolium]